MNEKLNIISEKDVFDRKFSIYGTLEMPLFLAKDVASWIEHSDVSTMTRSIDDDEKLVQTLFVSGQKRDCLFLTEDGVYEVLMQSRKPIAKQFKKEVKRILHWKTQFRMFNFPVLFQAFPQFLPVSARIFVLATKFPSFSALSFSGASLALI